MNVSTLRLKHYVATQTRFLTVLCAVVCVVGFAIAFTPFVTPAVAASPLAESATPVQEEAYGAGVSQSVSVSITDDTQAFTAGETLTDRSRYPYQNAEDPVVTGEANAQQATLTSLGIFIQYQAAPREDTTDPFYTGTEVIDEQELDEGQGEITATVPVADIVEQKEAFREEFGQEAVVTAEIYTEAEYEHTTPAGETVTSTVTTGGPVEHHGSMYAIASDSTQDMRSVDNQVTEPSTVATLANLLGLFGGLAAIAGFVTVRWAGRRIDPAAVSREIQKKRFNDWVTEVRSFTPEGNVNVVEVTTLPDLVNLAIDSQRRVLYHSQLNEYLVMDGETMFKYTPEGVEQSGATEFFGMNPDELDLEPFPDINEVREPAEGPQDISAASRRPSETED